MIRAHLDLLVALGVGITGLLLCLNAVMALMFALGYLVALLACWFAVDRDRPARTGAHYRLPDEK